MLGIVRAADGWVGINCLTGQHWLDVCAMLGLPEFGEHQIAIMLGGPERDEFFAKAQPLLDAMTVAEIVELSQAMRIPAAPVNDGASMLDCPQYAERGFFVEARRAADDSCARARRSGSRKPRWHSRARRRGRRARGCAMDHRRPNRPAPAVRCAAAVRGSEGARPEHVLGGRLSDLLPGRVRRRRRQGRVDPAARRAPLLRGVAPARAMTGTSAAPLWQGTNLNKRDITLDLTSQARPRDRRAGWPREADVVVENFSPRVVEQFGLDYDSLVTLNPDVIMVRMPGFGLAGPVARLCRLGAEHRADLRDVGGHRLPRRAAVQPAGARRSRSSACTPAVALLAALEHRAAPARAN